MAQYLLLSFNQKVPATANGRSLETIVQNASQGFGTVKEFKVSNELAKFTSTDQLMSVADELTKIDTIAFGLVTRAARSIQDLAKKITSDHNDGFADVCPQETFGQVDIPQLHVEVDDENDEEQLKFDEALEKWKWNETIFSSNRLIDEMHKNLQSEVSRMEEDLRTSGTAFTEAQTRLNNLRRRNEGSLLVRSLDPIGSKMQLVQSLEDYKASKAVKSPIYVDTANLTTVLVVVRSANGQQFEKGYELAESYIVPNSCQKLEQDGDFICYAVTLLRANVDDYKTAAKEKGWHVRDFKYSATMREDMIKEAKDAVDHYLNECKKYKEILENTFSHLSVVWMHIRALRVFVESTLLYGIPPNFKAYLIKSNTKGMQRIHKNLEQVFGDDMGGDDDDGADVDSEYHPYVSFNFNLLGLI
ncbi:V-ATPase subunit C family protein [Trichomonas vaginalis G3]|uniref:V-type proton ATPase subunit C n=1 Tax=Trichomonas vaginalis (strain ATCC PRA-98 / G3) TaxID=412133 RepID=A2FCW8_TRIV3|nr:proton-exporting ATPase activity, phosphorylative mechanism [Trichomonas vaginalis G3]EAX97254.1 V-ATPase subunit C family protein [Trichomonas vaginalis G3]KAI5535831.1 proton-exporting ATPase activity, phosphorylative mechanism [Trichomonas vaginalis G3]|eukprot:XP_001310184.1 V-ATPase subunit C family protein [Trichomonas vaginalis G3]